MNIPTQKLELTKGEIFTLKHILTRYGDETAYMLAEHKRERKAVEQEQGIPHELDCLACASFEADEEDAIDLYKLIDEQTEKQ